MEKPDKELIGQNPEKIDGVYIDDYLRALNEYMPVSEVFGKYIYRIASPYRKHTLIKKLVEGTLDNPENESHLVTMVVNAARHEQWDGLIITPNWSFGAVFDIKRKGLGHLTFYDNLSYILPSVKCVEYWKEQMQG